MHKVMKQKLGIELCKNTQKQHAVDIHHMMTHSQILKHFSLPDGKKKIRNHH